MNLFVHKKYFLIILMIVAAVSFWPQQARADILDSFSSISCSLYQSTVGKLITSVEEKALGLITDKANKATDWGAGELEDKVNEYLKDIGIDLDFIGGSTVPVHDEEQLKELI